MQRVSGIEDFYFAWYNVQFIISNSSFISAGRPKIDTIHTASRLDKKRRVRHTVGCACDD